MARLKIRQSASVRKKGEGKDSLKKVQGRPPADVAPTFRVKIRRKHDTQGKSVVNTFR